MRTGGRRLLFAGATTVIVAAPIRLPAGDAALAAAIAAIGVLAFSDHVVVSRYARSGGASVLTFDASGAMMVLMLAVAGPLPALALVTIPELAGVHYAGARPRRMARVANWPHTPAGCSRPGYCFQRFGPTQLISSCSGPARRSRRPGSQTRS
jgi:hypothetical protein